MSEKTAKGTLVYSTDCALNCLAINSKAELLAAAGRTFFQVFAIRNDKFIPLQRTKANSANRLTLPSTPSATDTINATEVGSSTSTILTPVASISTTGVVSASTNCTTNNVPVVRSHSVTDVAWSCDETILATGSTNGTLTLWDVGHTITQQKCFTGHTRSIHCIAFHPTKSSELVTASQDGTVKLFDMREHNPNLNTRAFIQRTTSPSPVFDVSYSPRNVHLFATAQENGTVCVWDTRQSARPYVAFQGHSRSITTLDWHPNWQGSGRNWLATAGAVDHLIKVWNFSQPVPSGQSGCPPLVYTVRTSNVSRVRWRPGYTTQLVSSCNQTFDLSAYLWDLRRPFLPYASFEEHRGIVTSIAWSPSETDCFYTVGRDGLLIRHCVAEGVRLAESASPIALSFSARGALAHAVSRDRVIASQPPRPVDETNVVTQSPFYRALPNTVSQHSSGSLSSAVASDGPPGFYAAPVASMSRSGSQVDCSTASSTVTRIATTHNLPPMGSNESADLFVRQAQSLLYYLEPRTEALLHVDWLDPRSALMPDMIVALAKHYVFIGPDVEHVCSKNAAVALRFGQSFLVQFWSMLRCVFGNLPLGSSERFKATTRPVVNSTNRVSTVTNTTRLVGSNATGELSDLRLAAQNAALLEENRKGSTLTIVGKTPLHQRPPTVRMKQQPTARLEQSALRLSDILQSIGMEWQPDQSVNMPISQPWTIVGNEGQPTSRVSQVRRSSVAHTDSHRTDATHPVPIESLIKSTKMAASFTTTQPPLHSARDPSTPVQMTGQAISSTIPIRRRRVMGSPTQKTRSPPDAVKWTSQPTQLGVSASSTHTAESLSEPADFLFHYEQQPSLELEREATGHGTDTEAREECMGATAEQRNAILSRVIGEPDDPIELDPSAIISEEAFNATTTVSNQLVTSHPSPARESAKPMSTSTAEVTGPPDFVGSGRVGTMKRTSSKTRPVAKPSVPTKTSSRTKSMNDVGPIPLTHDTTCASTGLNAVPNLLAALHPLRARQALMVDEEAGCPLPPSPSPCGLAGPDATALVSQWLLELVDAGHVQTVCTALLALGPERLRLSEWVSEARVTSWFNAYLDLLSRFRLWNIGARVIRQCASSKGGANSLHMPKTRRYTMGLQAVSRPSPAARSTGDTEPLDSRRHNGGTDTPIANLYTPQTSTANHSTSMSSNNASGNPRSRWKSGSGTPSGPTGTTPASTSLTVTGALSADICALNQASTMVAVHCGRCAKRLQATDVSLRETGGHAGWACSRHTSTADAINVTCALCHLTVRGLYVWCRGCSHGGHLEHMRDWLSRRSECPTGCGHRCEYG